MFNFQTFQGRRLAVQLSASKNRSRTIRQDSDAPPTRDPTKTLYIGNMPFDMSDQDLNKMFREVKGVVDVRIAIDRRTGQPRGFAHADFVDVDSAVKAYDYLRGREAGGRKLRCDYSVSTGKAADRLST